MSEPTPTLTPQTFWTEIRRSTEMRVHEARKHVPQSALEAACQDMPEVMSLSAALRAATFRERPAVIAEIKRASPSRGPIYLEADPASVAWHYVQSGATAISVLTEPYWFGGSNAALDEVARAVDVPVLRKDFMLHPYQIWEARALGADAVLLIAAFVGPMLAELVAIAHAAHMEALIEVHTAVERDAALELGARLIGVNNRDLQTLQVDPSTAERLIVRARGHVTWVAESGYRTRADLARAKRAGAHGVLIGEALMATNTPGQALADFLEAEPAP